MNWNELPSRSSSSVGSNARASCSAIMGCTEARLRVGKQRKSCSRCSNGSSSTINILSNVLASLQSASVSVDLCAVSGVAG